MLFKEDPCKIGVDNCVYYGALARNGQINEVLRSRYHGTSKTEGFDPKVLKAVDEKMDDGWYSTGTLRGGCYGSNEYYYNSYDNAIKNGKKCGFFDYAL